MTHRHKPLPPRRRPEADPLDERIAFCLRHSQGTMPIAIVVDDEGMRARAVALARGRPGCRLLEILTEAEYAARLDLPEETP